VDSLGFANIAPIHFIRNVSPESDYTWRKFNFYNNGYVPFHVFDGVLSGNWTSLGDFETNYNTRHALSSPLTVTLLSKSLTSTEAKMTVRVTLAEAGPAGLKVYIFLWEDNVGNWRYVERAYTTKDLTVTASGQTEDFSHTFTVEGGWVQNNMGFTVLVQAPSSPLEVRNAFTAKFVNVGVEPSSLGRVKTLFR
jgi:hypothetical protein